MPARTAESCDYRVAVAIEEFVRRWKPYTARSRRYSIFKLLKETVDPAWENYVKSLPVKDARRFYSKKFVFSDLAKEGGFLHVDNALRDLAKRVALARSSSIGNGALRSRGRLVYPESMFGLSHSELVFHQTVSSLRFLASDLYGEGKLPDAILSDGQKKGFSNKKEEVRPGDLCKTCGELTEFAAMPRDEDWPESDYDRTAKLSRRFCVKHRPKIGKEWNGAYRRASRSHELFNRQIFLLKQHTVNLGSFEVPKSKGVGSPFLWQLGQRQDLIPLETKRIRRLARELADCKITPRKANIVMLRERGLSQSEIARKLSITRQAVSKFMATESFKQLTEIYRRCA